MAVIGLAVVLVLVLWMMMLNQRFSETPAETTHTGQAAIGGAFTMVDHNGETVTEQTFLGKHALYFFGFTFCPDVCPLTMQHVTMALTMLGEAADRIQPVFVTIDPERDTPEALNAYVKHFHPAIRALTGSPAQVEAMIKTFKVYAKKVVTEDSTDYLMDHSSIVYVMDPQGQYVTHFSHQTKPGEMVTALRPLLRGATTP